jgi:Flp pilus assembly protein TadG
MQAIVKIWRSTRSSASDFLADSRAVSAIEFAMILPLMLVMFFGTVEFSSAVAIDRKVTLIARTLSDITSQSGTTVYDANLQNTFTASIAIMSPYDDTPVRASITQISIDANKIARVQWSKAATISNSATQATLATSSRNAGDIVTTMVPSALLVPSTYLVLSEVSYLYAPSVGYVLRSSITLSDVSYTRPRQVTCMIYSGVTTTC